ncbi:hypothetical protein BaRGS_00027105, partial [Batillaria attramentaria]
MGNKCTIVRIFAKWQTRHIYLPTPQPKQQSPEREPSFYPDCLSFCCGHAKPGIIVESETDTSRLPAGSVASSGEHKIASGHL